jgi:hypothetical protein
MPMTLDGFRDLIDSHGPDKAHWPAGLKADADAFLLSSAPARHLLAAALQVEDALHAVPPAKAPHGLLDRICEAIKDDAGPSDHNG